MIGIADPGVPRNELDAKTNTGPDVMPSPAKLDERRQEVVEAELDLGSRGRRT